MICNDVGKTVQINQDEPEDEDLSIDCLVADFFELVQIMFPDPAKAPSLLVCPSSIGRSSLNLSSM